MRMISVVERSASGDIEMLVILSEGNGGIGPQELVAEDLGQENVQRILLDNLAQTSFGR
jgi:hypothetical protein